MKRTVKTSLTIAAIPVASAFALTITPITQASARSLTSVSQVMNWFAEPEQGGEWEAQAKGDYTAAGLSMTTNQGGPQVSSIPLVAAGKYTFGMASADSILQAQAQGIPIVAVFAPFQTDPQVLIWHASAAIKSFADMNGHSVYVSGASPYWQYLKAHYQLNNTQQMSYTGSLVPFVKDTGAVIQGFITAEPYTLAHQNVAIKYELIAKSGFNPYQNLMFTTEQEIQKHPDVVAAFVKASQKGWYQYLKSPTLGDGLIVKDSPDYTKPQMLFAVNAEKALIDTGIAKKKGIGYMAPTAWATLATEMETVGMLPKGFDSKKAFTDKFIPKTPQK